MARFRPTPTRLAPGIRSRRYVAAYGAVPFTIALLAVWWGLRALPSGSVDIVVPGRPPRAVDLGPVPAAAYVATAALLAFAALVWVVGAVAWDAVPAWWVTGIPIVLTLGWTATLLGWIIAQGTDDGGRVILALVVTAMFTLLAAVMGTLSWRTIQGRV
ncbi:hypothetical protein F6B41_08480 [Microbacterium lushaniae]|nr:hypothetical protein F6B41_12865 [Microbacterium lushaniae]KAA9156260.1 hypothetical protein F6B41_08480 [Microbacterium lushaniae]